MVASQESPIFTYFLTCKIWPEQKPYIVFSEFNAK
jgi:hypothetical protein